MGTMLDNIAQPRVLPPRIVIHGKGGVGKTTLGADAPDAVVLPLEEGAGVLDVPCLPHPETYEDVMAASVELAEEEHPYRTLVIDTVDHLEPLVWDYVCRKKSGRTTYAHIEDFGYGKGYSFADPYWIDWFKSLDTLRAQGMTIVVLCHNEDKNTDDPQIGSYTRTAPKLHKRANALLYEWADLVGCLDIERVAHDVGDERKSRTTRTSKTTGQRVLYLEDSGAYVAKNRYDLAPEILIPKENPYGVLRSALLTALGIKSAPEPKEAA